MVIRGSWRTMYEFRSICLAEKGGSVNSYYGGAVMKKLIPLLGLFVVTFAGSVGAQADVQEREWYFQALLDGSPIGYHRFTLKNEGPEWVLESRAEFDVKLLFISAYRYDHRATERWRGNCLQSISSSTDDNGTRYAVDSVNTDEGLVVLTDRDRTRLSGCVMTFAYWNPEILQRNRLLNSQTGEYVDVKVNREGEELLTVRGEQVAAERYRLLAEGRRITVWYGAEDRRWLGLESVTEDGYVLRYQLQGPIPPAVSLSRR